MTGNKFQAVLVRFKELQILQKSLEKSTREGDEEFWVAVGAYGKAGLFKNKDAV